MLWSVSRLVADGSGGFAAEIWRNVAGFWTQLATTTSSGSGRLRFEVRGSSLKLFVDNVLKVSATDTMIAGPGLVGFRSSGGQTYDDFVSSTLS